MLIAGFEPFKPQKHQATQAHRRVVHYHEGGILARSLDDMLSTASLDVSLAPNGKVAGDQQAAGESPACVVMLNHASLTLADKHPYSRDVRRTRRPPIASSFRTRPTFYQPKDTHPETAYSGRGADRLQGAAGLLDSLMQSTFWSFVTITPLMMFVSRGIARGHCGDAAQRAAGARDLRRHGLAGHCTSTSAR